MERTVILRIAEYVRELAWYLTEQVVKSEERILTQINGKLDKLMSDVKVDQSVLDGILASVTAVEQEVEQLIASGDNSLARADVSGITDQITKIKSDVDAVLNPAPVDTGDGSDSGSTDDGSGDSAAPVDDGSAPTS